MNFPLYNYDLRMNSNFNKNEMILISFALHELYLTNTADEL